MKKISLLLLLLLAGLGVGSWRTKSWWETTTAPVAAAAPSPQSVMVEIPNGTSAQGIGALLAEKGVIRSADAWQWWTRIQGFKKTAGGFQAGTYEVSPAESLNQIAQKIWDGKIATRSYTIPEGWSMQQMAAYFERQGMFSAAEFMDAVKQIPRQKYPWLPQGIPHLEGFLYPDTYQLGATEQPSPQQIVQQMLNQFEALALPVYQQYGKAANLSLLQWVTLASIVEKEAVVARERGTIAGVFTNRLKQSIPLGSDPTVEYGLGIRQTKEKPLTFAQVETPSPYNTYMNPGLPPTPIASPGVPSLKATLQPEATEYLYFVARYDGTHVFSKTNEEHLAAQDKIRDRVEAEAQASPKAEPPAGSS
ncbi:endolytic transglycosylase MltG [filamentous cyanobacterium LEGE 11480]|uniref:Endolytic murein transglycosylase n=1 Tax=Romeriopsis navalis LEGE 11480 TaxID=2777977 RepID=A0A928VPG8_9CYAN|nr:endolytic transglycosylase MltG [Romeriopsis navalis]MBE9032286.1 endolytic transglycosylase MltG [Romeriopsis navalis LEGE 11480]